MIALTVCIAAQVADILTTLAALKRGAVEANPIYGKHPSAAKLVAFKAAFIGLVLWLQPPDLLLYLVAAFTFWIAYRNHNTQRD